MTRSKRSDYEWFLRADLSRYKGKYVAIVNKKVISSGSNAKSVYSNALKKSPKTRPTLAKVPMEDTMVLVIALNGNLQISVRKN